MGELGGKRDFYEMFASYPEAWEGFVVDAGAEQNAWEKAASSRISEDNGLDIWVSKNCRKKLSKTG